MLFFDYLTIRHLSGQDGALLLSLWDLMTKSRQNTSHNSRRHQQTRNNLQIREKRSFRVKRLIMWVLVLLLFFIQGNALCTRPTFENLEPPNSFLAASYEWQRPPFEEQKASFRQQMACNPLSIALPDVTRPFSQPKTPSKIISPLLFRAKEMLLF